MVKRRTFIRNISAAAAAALLLPYRLPASTLKNEIGIQLYTIREMVRDDLPETLKTLNKIGYSTVEAAGYYDGKFYGLMPETYKNLVVDSGLNPVSSHCRISVENASRVCDDHLEAGARFVVLPSAPEAERKTAAGYYALAEKLNAIGEICREKNLAFGYHNHAFEFQPVNGETPYDILLENTDDDLVFFQMDTYWTVYGGKDPLEYFKKSPHRFRLLHLKDMNNSPDKRSTEIGAGIIDFYTILKQSEKAGTEYVFVEQEEFRMEPVRSITESYHFLRSIMK